jgi:hypothetical protein
MLAAWGESLVGTLSFLRRINISARNDQLDVPHIFYDNQHSLPTERLFEFLALLIEVQPSIDQRRQG